MSNKQNKSNKKKTQTKQKQQKPAVQQQSILEKALGTNTGKKIFQSADNAVGSLYRRVRHGEHKTKEVKEKKQKYKQDFSQGVVPIKSISNGIVETTTGMYIKILEIMPVDYTKMSDEEKDITTQTFASMFSTGSHSLHLKIINCRNNPEPFINHIKNSCERERYQCIQSGKEYNEKVTECAMDKIETIKSICENSAITKRYFLIYKYEGHSTAYKDIWSNLTSLQNYYASTLSRIGNAVLPLTDREIAEFYYFFFNRNTCMEESYDDRCDRWYWDTENYNKTHKKKREVTFMDVLAPKGIRFTNDMFTFQDGQYKTHLVLTSDGHPYNAPTGWVTTALSGKMDGTEVDIYTRQLDRNYVEPILDQKNRLAISSAKNITNNAAKSEKAIAKIQNTAMITNALKSGEDLFDVVIIITLSGPTISSVREKKNILKRTLKSAGLKLEDSYQMTWDFYKATLPLMEMPSALFMMFKRNYLTSSLRSLYCFISTQMRDPNGYVFGINSDPTSQDIVAINMFNKEMFKNPHVFIEGTSGAGKTFSMSVIARSMRLLNTRIMCICPAKAFEYQMGCEAIGGEVIHLTPGSQDCINIMDILPRETGGDDTNAASSSLLAEKVTFLITWISLIAGEVLDDKKRGVLSTAVRNVYKEFGITDDDESIWVDKEKGVRKTMPLLVNLWDALDQSSLFTDVCAILEEFVDGRFSNFNKPTNVDLSNKYIVFDVDEMSIGKRLFAAIFFIPFHFSYTISMQNRFQKDLIFFEEAWKIMNNKIASSQVTEMIRLLRSYGTGVIFATQELSDMLKDDNGKAVLNNTATKIIFYSDNDACKLLSEHINLSPAEQSRISGFGHGDCLLIANNQRIFMHVEASEKEAIEFETDPNKIEARKRQMRGEN